MILVFGSINMDLVATVATIPRPGETVLAGGYATLFGGKGANQAVAAARAAEPGLVAMVGCVGEDQFGAMCRENLRANAVDDAGVVARPDAPTGCALITVDGRGENAITVASGANARLAANAVRDVAAGTVAVFQMEVPVEASLAVARRVRAAGGRVIWNLAPVPGDLAAAQLRAILAASDVLVVNEIEARAAAGLTDAPDAGFAADAAALALAGGLACVVTAGAQGAYAAASDGSVTHVPALAVTPVDTTGAGDTFVGVLAAGLERALSFAEACREACIAASLACLQLGAQPAMPTREAIRKAAA